MKIWSQTWSTTTIRKLLSTCTLFCPGFHGSCFIYLLIYFVCRWIALSRQAIIRLQGSGRFIIIISYQTPFVLIKLKWIWIVLFGCRLRKATVALPVFSGTFCVLSIGWNSGCITTDHRWKSTETGVEQVCAVTELCFFRGSDWALTWGRCALTDGHCRRPLNELGQTCRHPSVQLQVTSKRGGEVHLLSGSGGPPSGSGGLDFTSKLTTKSKAPNAKTKTVPRNSEISNTPICPQALRRNDRFLSQVQILYLLSVVMVVLVVFGSMEGYVLSNIEKPVF